MSKAPAEAKTVSEDSVRKKRRFNKQDLLHLEERVLDEFAKRQRQRSDIEREWKEIDRQLAMRPDKSHKLDPQTGRPDPSLRWLPEIELPLQAQTLEVLTADARRMIFPDTGSFFRAHAEVTDQYLQKVDFKSIILGDENDVPSIITQDNADKLVEGVVNHWHSQYDMPAHVDMINSESFKYGIGVGRGRMVKKSVMMKTSRGVVKEEQHIPILLPRSIKQTYPDDSGPNLMGEGYQLGPAVIYTKVMNFDDFRVAASKGSDDPNSINGGWIKSQLKDLVPDKKNNIELIEMEGDFTVPRKTTRSFFLPGIIVTVAKGGNGKEAVSKVVRIQFRKHGQNSYIEFPYHVEDINSAYPTSPLRKGWPIQKAACEALMQVVISAWLNNLPPIGYDRNDTVFAARGGPQWYPGAQWPTMGDVKVYGNLGSPEALFKIYVGFIQQYYDVTGVNAARLGAQTVSHTTAFAKEAELNRGTVRTVDYVRSMLKGPMTKWVDMEYRIAREHFKRSTIYLPASGYEGFVRIDKSHLPEEAFFELHGSGGPSEEQQKRQDRLSSAQMALQMDGMNVQLGGKPIMDIEELIRQTLREGGWIDVDAITSGGNAAQEPAQQQGVEPNPGEDQAAAQLQAVQAFVGQPSG